MTNTNRSQTSRQNGQLRDLEEEVDRYRRASEDALQQLDWCIGYLHGCGKTGLARGLATNRSHIRQHLLQRAKQPVPTETPQGPTDNTSRNNVRAVPSGNRIG